MKKIDVLYIKGKPSPNNDIEMLYSLRSLESFTKDYGRIFVTGELPTYVDPDKVIFTPEEDIGCPMINHWWKVTKTIEKTDIGENFVLMYDDIFFVKQTELATYPFYQKGQLGESQTGGILYKASLANAKHWLERNGYTTFDHELHMPCIYNRNNFMDMKNIYEPMKDKNPAMAIRSVYANMFLNNQPRKEDVKIRAANEYVEQITADSDCFSVSDQVFTCHAEPWLKQKLTHKSRWEK